MEISLFDVVLHEPDVALTDLALSVETLVFALVFVRMRPADSALRVRAALLFAALSASSLLGALYHGFFPLRTATPGGWLVWILTMTAIGGAATVFWMLIGSLGRKPPSWLTPVALAAFAAYVLFVVAVDYRFWVSIAFTVPPLLAFLGTLLARALRSSAPGAAAGIAAIALMFAASALQQLRIGIDPAWFNHNALYHLIQSVALVFLFVSLRRTTPEAAAA
jgi:hypothetical protein